MKYSKKLYVEPSIQLIEIDKAVMLEGNSAPVSDLEQRKKKNLSVSDPGVSDAETFDTNPFEVKE